MREMFDAIDSDRNGFVDVEELKSTFAGLGVPLSNNDVKQMLKEANIQGTRIFYEGLCMYICLFFIEELLWSVIIM